jgi:phosphinothricin acetyltransferase
MNSNISIRRGESDDLSQLVDIYNHYVNNTHITFDTEPFLVAARIPWFAQFSESGPYRLLVAEKDGVVVGYASSTNFKPRAAYNTSVETSVYLRPDEVGQGTGRALYRALLDILLEEPSVHRAYGGVALPNPTSEELHEQLGFEKVGTYREVGFKLDKYWDVSWYEKDLE